MPKFAVTVEITVYASDDLNAELDVCAHLDVIDWQNGEGFIVGDVELLEDEDDGA